MQTWKIKKRPVQKTKNPWFRRIAAIVLLALTVLFFSYDFPAYWNLAANAMRLPNGFQIKDEPFRLGLDLKGGTHLVYDADMTQIPGSERLEALEGVKNVIERRVNAFGVSEPLVQTTTTGGTYRLIIELAGISDVKQAIDQIGQTPVLEFKEPGDEVGLELTEEEKKQLKEAQEKDRAAAKDVLARARKGADFDKLIEEKSLLKLEQSTIKNITANSPFGDFQILVEKHKLQAGQINPALQEREDGINLFRVESRQEVKEMDLAHVLVCYEGKTGCQDPIAEIEALIKIQKLKEQATAENFATLDGAQDLGWATADRYVPAFGIEAASTSVGQISKVIETEFGLHLIYKKDERTVPSSTIKRILLPLTTVTDIVPESSPWKNTELSGKHLKRSSVQFDPNTSAPNVVLDFNEDGSKLFGELTQAHIGERVAIFLDGKVISAPVVQQAIFGGQAVITGDFTLDEAKLLAQNLNAGALPVPINLLSQQTIGPTLGLVSLQKSITAAYIGFLLVALFMIAVYRLPGLIATIALALFVALNIAAYKFFGVTITLSGIAGLVLSIGIAVDANVLIFARMREEFAAGRDFTSALDEGFKRAWSAIRDGHLTTLIAAAVLYWFSSSFIRGFALTLSVGVILSLFTAITVTRVYLKNVIAWKWARNHHLFALKK